MSKSDPNDDRLDHVVVLMFENRSFDNLLGYLYPPGESPEFEGIPSIPPTNVVPEYAGNLGRAEFATHRALNPSSPYPDPGEEFPHVNTQLFGSVLPESNRFAEIGDMDPPYNAPVGGTAAPASMGGFVTDYLGAFRVAMGRLPSADECAQIMACYEPDQVPVLSELARSFACFDHWFCEVPSQTYPNRSFFHAATSSGFVLNGHPPGKFATRNDAATIFNRLEEHGRSWRVFIDPAQFLPATGLIHALRLAPYFATHFATLGDFFYEATTGSLPDYAFLEPNMFHPHSDMHPHSGARWAESMHLRPPDTLLRGEQLLARVYESVRTSSSATGSSWRNTALLITFDEHGGTFDHIPPPPVSPPDGKAGEEGFGFDRLGVRVPSLLISAWTDAAIVHEPFRHTSMIRTLRDWWHLGPALTLRDESAPSLRPILNRTVPRDPEDWPAVAARSRTLGERADEEFLRAVERLDSPMEALERDLLGDALAHESRVLGRPPAADTRTVSHREAHAHFRRISLDLFPGIDGGRPS